ncbi:MULTISPECIES: ACT domain-containing protein [Anaerostipes]|uniref:ACT domain-containing protein n=1 Tax=Anaerostipes TaxID=207244 RepID=UPI000951D7DC|nr:MULTISPECIES: ACT domain-containing protein [Anaerostipes]MCI5622784.1 ACT domain-containing protein [Anaerostipes sp.]MDY2726758.1 ACT domain-containing protein [Anaerostipes faecalis]OLR58622.1 amino acid-binding protein [Anaerostipes sp. 494a]
MEKMLFSGVQSNSDVALIAIKGIKNQPGIAAKVFGSIAEEHINVELILQSIGRGDKKDISFVVGKDDAQAAVDTLKKAFSEDDYDEIVCDTAVGIVSIVGAGMMSNSGAASKMFEALYNKGINIKMIYTSEIKITVLIKESRVERAVEALKEQFQE